MDTAIAGDHWSKRRHRLWTLLPLPLSLILFGCLHSPWICNVRAGFWIRDGARQVFKAAENSGCDSNAGCRPGYNTTGWGFYRCWCATTTCTGRGCWWLYWLSLSSARVESHELTDISNTRSVQRRWGGGVLTLDCIGYRTPSLRGIPPASRHRSASLNRHKLRIPQRPTLGLILTISLAANISYDRSRVGVRGCVRHIPI